MANYIFKTPTAQEGPIGNHRLFYFRKAKKGITIYKTGGVYYQTRYIVDSDQAGWTETYRGGYNYVVDDATRTALIAGGVGVDSTNFTAI